MTVPVALPASDPAMCAVLAQHGIAAGNLLMLRPGTPDPLGSDVVLATAAVRDMFGTRLASVYAPELLASFGTGPARIDVRAVAWDPTKRLDPAQEQITLEVTRDLTALPVAWRQAGSTWTARIPPGSTVGPTVIRVVARDAYGAEIGRGFVEIADTVQGPR